MLRTLNVQAFPVSRSIFDYSSFTNQPFDLYWWLSHAYRLLAILLSFSISRFSFSWLCILITWLFLVILVGRFCRVGFICFVRLIRRARTFGCVWFCLAALRVFWLVFLSLVLHNCTLTCSYYWLYWVWLPRAFHFAWNAPLDFWVIILYTSFHWHSPTQWRLTHLHTPCIFTRLPCFWVWISTYFCIPVVLAVCYMSISGVLTAYPHFLCWVHLFTFSLNYLL